MIGRLRSLTQRLEALLWSKNSYKFVRRQLFHGSDGDSARQVIATMRSMQLMKPVVHAGLQNKRLLVFAPHPDDEMIGPGGTLLLAQAAACKVTVVYLTSGGSEQRIVREQEARRVCAELGWQPIFLNLPSQTLATTDQDLAQLKELVGSHDALFLPFFLDDHLEHRLASQVLGRLDLPADSIEVWAYQVYSAVVPNVIVDISSQIERKKKLIGLYESQMSSRNWAHYAAGLNAWNVRLLPGATGEQYAEAFFVLPNQDYCTLASQYFH